MAASVPDQSLSAADPLAKAAAMATETSLGSRTEGGKGGWRGGKRGRGWSLAQTG